jgi:hypothetical protein
MVMGFIVKVIVIVAAAAYIRELSRQEVGCLKSCSIFDVDGAIGNKFKWVPPFRTEGQVLDNRTSAEGEVLDNRTTRDYIRQEMMEEMVKSGYRLINSTIA